MLRPFLIGSMLAFASCASAPPYKVTSTSGTVHANTPELASAGAHELELAKAFLHEELPGLRETPIRVWIQDRPYAGLATPIRQQVVAFSIKAGSWIEPRIHVASETFKNDLTHELVHQLLNDQWEVMPDALEEGLCDVMHMRFRTVAGLDRGRTLAMVNFLVLETKLHSRLVRPDGSSSRPRASWGYERLSDPSQLPTLSPYEALTLEGPGAWSDLDAPEVGYIYGLGYFLADRIVARYGPAHLYGMCQRAAREGRTLLTPQEIFDAAGLRDEQEVEALVRAKTAELLSSMTFDGEFLLVSLGNIRKLHEYQCQTPGEFQRVHELELSFDGGEPQPLWQIEGSVGWFHEHWSELSPGEAPGCGDL